MLLYDKEQLNLKYNRNEILTFCELLLYLEKVKNKKKVEARESDASDLLEVPDT